MRMLSEDDLDLRGMTEEELDLAWDLWFDLAQTTNDSDPPYTHGVFVNLTWEDFDPARDPDSDCDTADLDRDLDRAVTHSTTGSGDSAAERRTRSRCCSDTP